MTKADIAWAAGLFEGEGSISIQPVTQRNCCVLDVCVTNTDLDVLHFLRDRWGGPVRPRKPGSARHRQPYRWRLVSNQAAVFLRAIEPFVVRAQVKKRIAVALKFQDGKRFGRPLDDVGDYAAFQLSLYREMRILNLRGASATCPNRDQFKKGR